MQITRCLTNRNKAAATDLHTQKRKTWKKTRKEKGHLYRPPTIIPVSVAHFLKKSKSFLFESFWCIRGIKWDIGQIWINLLFLNLTYILKTFISKEFFLIIIAKSEESGNKELYRDKRMFFEKLQLGHCGS